MKLVKLSLPLSLLLSVNTFADENTNLDNLLGEYTQKSDLSMETKLLNTGHSIIYTRNDIERMQARNLRDILKTLPLYSYRESRFGVSNLNSIGDLPFSSSTIKVYLDDHEMMDGAYGSGFPIFGKIELEFVDHIEIYYDTPSFEFSAESTELLIKLHTKVPDRDKGGKVLLTNGSYGANQQTTFYTDKIDNISYFTYVSNDNQDKNNIYINDEEIERDTQRKHFLGTLYNDNNHLLVDAQKADFNPISNMSLDGSSNGSKVKFDNLQISYLNTSFDNLKLKANYQQSTTTSNFHDDSPFFYDQNIGSVNNFYSKYNEETFSSEADYNFKTQKNSLYLGVNNRIKKVDIEDIKLNDYYDYEASKYDRQYINSAYIQNEFTINDNSLISAGVKYSNVDNNGEATDHDLLLYRIGYVYNKNNFNGKLFYYHTPHLLEPYLYTYWFQNKTDLKSEVSDVVETQFDYTYEKNYYSLILGTSNQKNQIYFNPYYSYDALYGVYSGSVDNFNDEVRKDFINFDYKYDFDSLNSLAFNTFSNFIKDGPLGAYDEYGGFIRFLNTIDKYYIFNELSFRRDTIVNENYFDYSTGVKYKYLENLSFSVKGENILNDGRSEKIYHTLTRIQTGEFDPIDKRLLLTMEYMY